LAVALFVMFAKLPDCWFRESIRSIIFELERVADQMENSQKQASAIQQINEVLGWPDIVLALNWMDHRCQGGCKVHIMK
jgi:glutaredoxin-related protein